MKQTLIGLAASATLALAGAAHAQDTVRIGTEGAYAPWNYIDDSGTLAGFEIDLGNELCARAEVTCEFVQNEWDSIIPNLQAGNYDMIMAGMAITDERMEQIGFTDYYYPPNPSRYVAAEGGEFDFENLDGLKIGVQGATIQAAYAEENFGDGNTILAFETPDQSVSDMMAGNLDLILADSSFLQPIVDGSGGRIEFVGPEVGIGNGVGAGMRKDDDELKLAMADALAEVKADGTLDALIMEYFDAGPFFSE